jgi:predicted transposase YdaD
LFNLKDSSFYQVILTEGREEAREQGRKVGYKEGLRIGRIAGAKTILLHVRRTRLGPISKKARVAIEAIDDLTRLERLGQRMLDVSSWSELFAEPE